jgi:hypothetical protein
MVCTALRRQFALEAGSGRGDLAVDLPQPAIRPEHVIAGLPEFRGGKTTVVLGVGDMRAAVADLTSELGLAQAGRVPQSDQKVRPRSAAGRRPRLASVRHIPSQARTYYPDLEAEQAIHDRLVATEIIRSPEMPC